MQVSGAGGALGGPAQTGVMNFGGNPANLGASPHDWGFAKNACLLEGRHGGLVGTKTLGEENGPCLLYGYDYGFVFGFLCLLCMPVDVVEGISLRACCFDGDVCNVGEGGG